MKNTTKKYPLRKDKKMISLYVPANLVKLLKLKASKEERSLNYTVVKILETSFN